MLLCYFDDTTHELQARACLHVSVAPDSVAWLGLVFQGQVASSFKQLTAETRIHLQQAVELMVEAELTEEEKSDEELAEFVAFCRNHPGSVWKEDPPLHRQKLVEVQLSPAYVVVNTKSIEKQTRHRFLPVLWTRTVPLLEGQEFGPPKVIRQVKTLETSRLRSNARCSGLIRWCCSRNVFHRISHACWCDASSSPSYV
jgi:hypothetical protein